MKTDQRTQTHKMTRTSARWSPQIGKESWTTQQSNPEGERSTRSNSHPIQRLVHTLHDWLRTNQNQNSRFITFSLTRSQQQTTTRFQTSQLRACGERRPPSKHHGQCGPEEKLRRTLGNRKSVKVIDSRNHVEERHGASYHRFQKSSR